jgi:hypothetical protein
MEKMNLVLTVVALVAINTKIDHDGRYSELE